MKNVFLFGIAFLLLIVAFFTFAILGAGSHGHLGLFDHADSFLLYAIIFGCLYYFFKINIYGLKLVGKNVMTFEKIVFLIFLFIFFLILVLFFTELFSDSPNIRLRDWILMAAFSTIFVMGYKKIIANNSIK
ncbi:MAG: hypothetical protein D8M58_00085 [Calditrichaeota bacterium]|nr:MAG: hypothetical protein DWQ03_06995 [Calditrichota bacterium]MBL1203767.1 hypothetical protein [Calditrichota bacterium]NOG43597.1 hypothetical protein [Calditrichota bacterium]